MADDYGIKKFLKEKFGLDPDARAAKDAERGTGPYNPGQYPIADAGWNFIKSITQGARPPTVEEAKEMGSDTLGMFDVPGGSQLAAGSFVKKAPLKTLTELTGVKNLAELPRKELTELFFPKGPAVILKKESVTGGPGMFSAFNKQNEILGAVAKDISKVDNPYQLVERFNKGKDIPTGFSLKDKQEWIEHAKSMGDNPDNVAGYFQPSYERPTIVIKETESPLANLGVTQHELEHSSDFLGSLDKGYKGFASRPSYRGLTSNDYDFIKIRRNLEAEGLPSNSSSNLSDPLELLRKIYEDKVASGDLIGADRILKQGHHGKYRSYETDYPLEQAVKAAHKENLPIDKDLLAWFLKNGYTLSAALAAIAAGATMSSESQAEENPKYKALEDLKNEYNKKK